jgi:hypothetical protein
MVLGKEELWERIRIKSVWLQPVRTPFFTAAEEHMMAGPVLRENYMRYIVMLLFQGNAVVAQSGNIEKYHEDGTFEVVISDVQIQPAAMPQIPQGAPQIDSPFMSIEGGTNLYGTVNGNSINVSVVYWDNEI